MREYQEKVQAEKRRSRTHPRADARQKPLCAKLSRAQQDAEREERALWTSPQNNGKLSGAIQGLK